MTVEGRPYFAPVSADVGNYGQTLANISLADGRSAEIREPEKPGRTRPLGIKIGNGMCKVATSACAWGGVRVRRLEVSQSQVGVRKLRARGDLGARRMAEPATGAAGAGLGCSQCIGCRQCHGTRIGTSPRGRPCIGDGPPTWMGRSARSAAAAGTPAGRRATGGGSRCKPRVAGGAQHGRDGVFPRNARRHGAHDQHGRDGVFSSAARRHRAHDQHERDGVFSSNARRHGAHDQHRRDGAFSSDARRHGAHDQHERDGVFPRSARRHGAHDQHRRDGAFSSDARSHRAHDRD
jgi:hypothetical protein